MRMETLCGVSSFFFSPPDYRDPYQGWLQRNRHPDPTVGSETGAYT